MPRHTHPAPVRKHSRAHVRAQRERVIAKRWRFAKRRYPDRALIDTRRLRGLESSAASFPGTPMVFVHPDSSDPALAVLKRWPFSVPRGSYTRNPFPQCSCFMCTRIDHFEPRRARRRRELHDIVADALSEREGELSGSPLLRDL
jgi:hypothetical protein